MFGVPSQRPFGPGPAFVIETVTGQEDVLDNVWTLIEAPLPLLPRAAARTEPLTIDMGQSAAGDGPDPPTESLDMVIEDYEAPRAVLVPPPLALPSPSLLPSVPSPPPPMRHRPEGQDEQKRRDKEQHERLRREFWHTLPHMLRRTDRFFATTLSYAGACAVCGASMCAGDGEDACTRGAAQRPDASECTLAAEEDCVRQLLALRCRWNGTMIARDVWVTVPCNHAVHSLCALRALQNVDPTPCLQCGAAVTRVDALLDSVVSQHRRAWLETGGGKTTAAVHVAQAMWIADRWRRPPPRLTTAMVDEVAHGGAASAARPSAADNGGAAVPVRQRRVETTTATVLGRMERAHALLERKPALLRDMRDALQRDDPRAFWLAAETLHALAPPSAPADRPLWHRVEPPRDYRPNVDAAAAIVLQALIVPTAHADVLRWLDDEGFIDADTLRHLARHGGAMAAMDTGASRSSRARLVRALARAASNIDKEAKLSSFLAPWRSIVLQAPSEDVRALALASAARAPRLLDEWRRAARTQGRWAASRALEVPV